MKHSNIFIAEFLNKKMQSGKFYSINEIRQILKNSKGFEISFKTMQSIIENECDAFIVKEIHTRGKNIPTRVYKRIAKITYFDLLKPKK